MTYLRHISFTNHDFTICYVKWSGDFSPNFSNCFNKSYVNSQRILVSLPLNMWQIRKFHAIFHTQIMILQSAMSVILIALLVITRVSFKRIQFSNVFLQTQGGLFNKAMITNIGFVETLKMAKYGGYVFNDVDLLPRDSRISYGIPNVPTHMSAGCDKFNYKVWFLYSLRYYIISNKFAVISIHRF